MSYISHAAYETRFVPDTKFIAYFGSIMHGCDRCRRFFNIEMSKTLKFCLVLAKTAVLHALIMDL